MAQFQLIVRNGTIVDGSGSEPFQADIGIQAGVITAIGTISERGDEEIDATGRIVTPGFVDVHTHYDGQITWEHQFAPSSQHGVTTVVMGNCGVGFAPVRDGDHDLVIRLMEGVEDIPQIVMAEGVPWNWRTFPEYLDALAERKADIDFACQLPHSPLRVFVMGERGANLEPATDDDLEAMRALTREAVEAGALGVSTSRNLFHRFRDGKLAPSVNTPEDELIALASGLADAGSGVFQLNLNIDAEADGEVAAISRIARETGRPVNFSLLDLAFRPDNWGTYVEALRQADEDGIPLRGQFLPRPIGLLFGLDLTLHHFALNPSFRPLANLPLAEKVARMRDPELRARLLAEEPDDPNPSFVAIIHNAKKLFALSDPADYHPRPEDMLDVRAQQAGISFKEMVYDALLEDDGRAVLAVVGSDTDAYLEKTRDLFDRPNLVVGLGDGGAHYASVCDAPYPTYILTQRIGENGLPLPKAIQALSSKAAESLGLYDRGRLSIGYKADLNIIDIDRLTLHRPSIEQSLPAGGKRLVQKAQGYAATIVNGVVTYKEGIATGALPGRLVRGEQPRPMAA
ncbi:amidohydrolase family protein (plasmid) [Rhizorhabdus wittichii]|uniref:Amidohydrolase family protein n=1 Tax=Rhizorhabdus wittichii TaxID=160791 RepID=A0A975D977_9SPHN|nr:amidohydrolase family protein [Rhizorhabdus wittichii]QTH24999.1 amidohydrolase family protein [Rhizorhabdus wittichii]